ncbi:EAL domain-containing protein [Devosia sp.]|uniref:EAL domain-containing protein n=1 Tax=Devosia sp. TaxID=1871048 RepID=UPI003BAC2D82
MHSVRRLVALCCFSAGLIAFWLVRNALAGDAAGLGLLAAVAQMGGPALAVVCSVLAARGSTGTDRLAWRYFTIGSALYLLGNIGYVALLLSGVEVAFPSIPEAAYFAMAGAFALGIFQYARLGQRIGRVQLYNFVLIFAAVALASLFALSDHLSSSVLTPFGTAVAFLYPALWFSVAAFAMISMFVYGHRSRSWPFILLIGAVLTESGADLIYAQELVSGTFTVGGMSQLLWVASAGLIVWAALEQIWLKRAGGASAGADLPHSDRSLAQATVPALAIAIVLIAGSLSGALGQGPLMWFSAGLALVFAAVVGLREHWMIHVQKQLRGAIGRSRSELMATQDRLSSVIESTSDSILVLDRDWKVVFFNQNAAHTINKADLLHMGISVWELFPAAETSGEGDHYKRAVATGEAAEFEIFVQDRGVWLGIHAYPTTEGLSIFFRDISEERRIRDEFAHMAHHDALTGLDNRLLFQTRLQQELGKGHQVAVLMLDLDHFKEVNDTLGHQVGDAVLTGTADRLGASARNARSVARLGGDEFAVVIADYGSVSDVRGMARDILAATRAPHQIDGQAVLVGGSIGIALSEDSGGDADRIMKQADLALYAAKSEARGGLCVFEPKMEAGLIERQQLRADLRLGLERGEFELVYQPILELKTERICSFEALLRWRHPRLGMVSPAGFIDLAEESGLIVPIGEWVLKTACVEAAKWPEQVSVAVNLSTRQFADSGLTEMIEQALGGMSPTRLEIEITESVLLKDSRANLLTLRKLRSLGIRLALDDFGTGYSSLGYLQRFPFNKLKIDRSFISGLPASEEGQAIVRSVIGLGQSLGLRVTAEGVETQAQYDWVRQGCDEAQGYLISKPVTADDIPALFQRIGVMDAVAPSHERRAV